uniref:Tectonic domain-containing protein n=1 Tax=Dendroctonus ponderosae TaxID=77166 RepID=A0AAR5QCK5_DENPD
MALLRFIGLVLVCTCRLSVQTSKTPEPAPETESTPIDSTTTDYSTSTVETCDSGFGNCTNLTATEAPLEAGKNNGTRHFNETKHRSLGKWSEADVCTCDLQEKSCDINCCCDLHCSAADKELFDHCQLDDNRFFDDRYCKYTKHIYVNNTAFEWEVNQDGMFCVITRNLPDSHLLQKDQPIGPLEAFSPRHSFWGNGVLPVPQLTEARKYGYGDSIWIVKNDSSFDVLRMPKSVLSQVCSFEEDIHFLINEQSRCSPVAAAEGNEALILSSYFSGFKILANPKSVNASSAKKNFYYSCPKNVCLEIQAKLCDVHLNNCFKVKNASNMSFQCSYDIRNNLNNCQNAAQRVHWRFFHNATSGIYEVDILAVLANFSYHFGREDLQFTQHFSWEFLWDNRTKNYSEIFSGNPGYIFGKPILIARKHQKANETSIQRSSARYIDNFLVFPQSSEGACVRNDTNYAAIEFGYGMRNKCRLQKMQAFNHTKNATEICKEIQRTVFDLWGIQPNASVVFGLFGSASAKILEDWSDAFYKKNPSTLLNQTIGKIINKNSSIVCYNISTLLNVDIFHSRVDFKTVLNQQKILGVAFNFRNLLNPNFALKRLNQSWIVDFGLDLTSQVSFHDVTGRKAIKFVDPPSLDIRLPYDFFYPFVKIGNGTRAVWPSFALFLAIYAFKLVVLSVF